jgi:hypothetical protein
METITEKKSVKQESAEERKMVKDELPGVFCRGVQYYDLKDIRFITNSRLVSLINHMRALVQQGVEVQFVNVCASIKQKICSLGLNKLFHIE